MKRVQLLLLLGTCMVFVLQSHAQELPPIRNFSPTDYQAENQNWSISQAGDKRIYIANNKGLLQYDGSRWTLYPSPNESVMRSVRVIGERIYTGCYREFGYWEADLTGILKYTSLSQSLSLSMAPDEEFWRILEIDGTLIFSSLDRIYIYDPKAETIRSIDSGTPISAVFDVEGILYYQKLKQGIFTLVNGQEVLLSEYPDLVNDEVVHMSNSDGLLVLLTRNTGFFTLDGEAGMPLSEVKPIATEADALLAEASVYNANRLQDGTYMLGTVSEGLIHLSAQGNLLEQIDQLRGLGNNTVLSLLEDVDGNIWLGLDNGVSMLNLQSPFRFYYDKEGKLGSIYTSAYQEGYFYLGTNQGLFYKREGDGEDFSLIEGTRGQVWSLEIIGETLFCNHHLGTFEVFGEGVRKIGGTRGSWLIKEIPENPKLLMLGSYDGLHILEASDSTWRLRNRIQDFEHSSRFVEWHDGKVFVNHEYKGVFRLELDSELRRALNVEVDSTLKGADSGIASFGDALLYSNREGIFYYDGSRNQFQRDSVLSTLYDPQSYLSGRMISDPEDSRMWIFTQSGIESISHGSLSSSLRVEHIAVSQDVRNGIAGYENFRLHPEKGSYVFGNRSGYLTVNLQEAEELDFDLALSRVELLHRDSRKPSGSYLSLLEPEVLDSEQNNLEVLFRTSQLAAHPVPEYQYRLHGLYPQWSAWSPDPLVRFENLSSGTYKLQVRGRMGEKPAANTLDYSFTIAPPWYASTGMIFLYFLGLVLSGLFIHLSYRVYFRKRQDILMEGNRKELELVRTRNEKEIIRMKNEQLKKEFQDKSNELAASTMSIIKKNELLSRVKHRLLGTSEQSSEIKDIVNIIDDSLMGSDDWEMFREAFNNADREFLSRLKEAHPSLSPNDIKLCAYLRLNLSSKEIAPLFNISVRSVEIKRYRLRKKMNLERDENLVNYILTL